MSLILVGNLFIGYQRIHGSFADTPSPSAQKSSTNMGWKACAYRGFGTVILAVVPPLETSTSTNSSLLELLQLHPNMII